MYVNKHDHERSLMIEEQLIARGIHDIRVLRAMAKVPREFFVLPEQSELAYQDSALPLIKNQTISQPYVVAYMTEALKVKPEDRVLEIGTGSGYQTAVLAELAKEVCTLEIVEELYKRARKILKKLEYNNIEFQLRSGKKGWEDDGTFNKIMITAAAETVPPVLLNQLASMGRLILPLKQTNGSQMLVLIHKDEKGELRQEKLLPVEFVTLK